ncbi:MAG: GNAT family N-acetyltransferase [Hyphomicrobium sp.]|nr:MAG: GNAT family N-acetyltransferase [Hyphomicrobium sp.]
MPHTKPDAGLSIHLGDDLVLGRARTLAPLDPALADPLGEAFAALSPWRDYPFSAAALAGYFRGIQPDAPRLAIRVGDQVAGIAGLRRSWLRGPYLQFLGVLPAYQGHGLGSAVLDWFERDARAMEERNLWAATSDFNGDAFRFYTRAGYRETARIDGLIRDDRTEILMRKRLD